MRDCCFGIKFHNILPGAKNLNYNSLNNIFYSSHLKDAQRIVLNAIAVVSSGAEILS